MLSYCLYAYLITWMGYLHPFYISVTDMVYNADLQRLEIAQKVFWDDLEVALGSGQQRKVDFLHPEDPEKLALWIEDYLLQKNEIYVNQERIELVYLGYEVEEDAAWFYMEAENMPFPQVMTIKNSLLFDHFPTQQNIVNFYLGEKPKSFITRIDKPQGELKF